MAGEATFHVLARAAVVVDGHVLLASAVGADNTFLPGGHVQPDEPIIRSLERELREELGATARVAAYLGAVEATWHEGGAQHHEINHVFEVHLPLSPDRPVLSLEPHLKFVWSPIGDLDRHNLLPFALRDLLRRWARGDRSTWWVSA